MGLCEGGPWCAAKAIPPIEAEIGPKDLSGWELFAKKPIEPVS